MAKLHVIPVPGRSQVQTVSDVLRGLEGSPRLKVIVLMADGSQIVAVLPDADRAALEEQLPAVNGKDLVTMTEQQAKQYGVL
jgi:3,4-dihydroxy-2-butanone 4-phosphate synthase